MRWSQACTHAPSASSTVWAILKTARIDPAAHRASQTWTTFLRRQAAGIDACDFFTAELLDGTQACVLAVIEHATRRVRILGVTLHPAGEWTAPARAAILKSDEELS